MNFDILAESERVHIANAKWWPENKADRDKGEQIMLVITELSECMEGARKNLMDDHLPQYKMEHVEIIDALIRLLDFRWGHGTRETFIGLDNYFEFVPPVDPRTGKVATVGLMLLNITECLNKLYIYQDTLYLDNAIRMLFAYALWRGFLEQVPEIYEAKMAYNAVRADHTKEAREGEYGKKW